VSAEIITSDADPQLRRNSLGLAELVFQGVTHIAPATNIVFTFPIIALKAGPDMPLSFLLSTIVCVFIGIPWPSSRGTCRRAAVTIRSPLVDSATAAALWRPVVTSSTRSLDRGCMGFLGYLISDMLQMQF
jgi:hypothetical protein